MTAFQRYLFKFMMPKDNYETSDETLALPSRKTKNPNHYVHNLASCDQRICLKTKKPEIIDD